MIKKDIPKHTLLPKEQPDYHTLTVDTNGHITIVSGDYIVNYDQYIYTTDTTTIGGGHFDTIYDNGTSTYPIGSVKYDGTRLMFWDGTLWRDITTTTYE